MYLHENKELFNEIVDQTSISTGRTTAVIEKDYYVTMILRLLSEQLTNVVFKGGTSLSKGYHVINRFSEDIDITFDEHIGEARRKKLKNKVLKGISEELNMPISNFESTQSDRDYNAYYFTYNSVWNTDNDQMLSSVKLETALGSYAFPTEKILVDNYIGEYLRNRNKVDFCMEYKLEKFEMKLQSLERTYVDKIFALCDYYMQGKSKRYSRHLYDICKLSPRIEFDENFKVLYEQIRQHRKQMSICPSAQDGVNIPELINKWCNEDYYKEDYLSITNYFVEDSVEYEDAKKQMIKISSILNTMN
jgi:predicted nucleotidyltransferase component of viral defense system